MMITKKLKPSKRTGTDQNEYEMTYCGYMFLRAGLDNTVQDFQLLNNVDKLGSMDDVVFSYKKDNKWMEYVFQFKLTKNNTLCEKTIVGYKNFLSLAKECGSYNDVVKYYLNYEMKGTFDDCCLVLFTNAKKNDNMNKHILNVPPNQVSYSVPLNLKIIENKFEIKVGMDNYYMKINEKDIKVNKTTNCSFDMNLSTKSFWYVSGNESIEVKNIDFNIPYMKNYLNISCDFLMNFEFMIVMPPGDHCVTVNEHSWNDCSGLTMAITEQKIVINGIDVGDSVAMQLNIGRYYPATGGHVFKLKTKSKIYNDLIDYVKNKNASTPIEEDIVNGIEDENPENFGRRVVFFSQQANVNHLIKLSQGLLRHGFNEFNDKTVRIVSGMVMQFVKEKCEQGSLFFFTKEVFNNVISEIILSSITADCLSSIRLNTEVTIGKPTIEKVQNIIDGNERVKFVVCDKPDAPFLLNAVAGVMTDEETLSNMDDKLKKDAFVLFSMEAKSVLKRVLYLDLKNALKYFDLLKTFLANNQKVVLVLDCMRYDRRVQEILSEEFSNSKIVALGKTDDEEEFTDSIDRKEGFEFFWEDLEEQSRLLLLDKEILYQGMTTSPQEILPDEELWRRMPARHLEKLVQGEKHALALGVPLSPPNPHYIERRIQAKLIVDINLCREDKKHVYVVENAKEIPRLKEILPDLNKRNIRSELKGYNGTVHFLRFTQEEVFVWVKSLGSSINEGVLRDFVLSENDIEKAPGNFVCISDDPGSGKSLLLLALAFRLKNTFKNRLVLYINLNDHAEYFNDFDFNDLTDVVRFLTHHMFSKVDMFLEAFMGILLRKDSFVLLDGFDEVSPMYGFKISKLVSILLNQTSAKVFLSSRKYINVTFDNVFYPLFTISPFTIDEKRRYFRSYWGRKLMGDVLEKYVEDVLLLVGRSLSDDRLRFLGLPLQLGMIAEGFEQRLTATYDPLVIPKEISMLHLFEMFVNMKVRRMLVEVFRIPKFNAHLPQLQDNEFRQMEELHMKAALVAVVDVKSLGTSLEPLDFSLIEQGKEIHGVISRIVNNVPFFVHKSYAEYYVGIWFTRHFSENQDFIRENIFKEGFRLIRCFFDLKLCENHPIHVSVVMNAWRGEKVSERDAGGRNILHLAVAYCGRRAVESMLEGGGWDEPDGVLGWRPLVYADRTASWDVLGAVLEKHSGFEDLTTARVRLEKEKNVRAATFAAIRNDYLSLFGFMYENYAHVFRVLKESSFLWSRLWALQIEDLSSEVLRKLQPVHVSALCGAVRIFHLLVQEAGHEDRELSAVCAAVRNKTAILELLNGLETNLDRPAEGLSALHLACANKSTLCVTRLLEHGARVNALTPTTMETPLHIAIINNHDNNDIAKILIQNGADVNIANKKGETPLCKAAEYENVEILEFCRAERGESAALLTNAFMNVFRDVPVAETNGFDALGRTPLFHAVRLGRVLRVSELMALGADAACCDDSGVGPFHLAVENEDVDMLKVLTSDGRGVDSKCNRFGDTPLHLACQYGLEEMVVILVEELGADVNLLNRNNQSPLLVALGRGHEDIALYLIERGSDLEIEDFDDKNSAFLLAAEMGSISILELLIEKGCRFNGVDRRNVNALVRAINNGRDGAAMFLLEKGIDIREDCGLYPLHLALRRGQWGLIPKLIDSGADVDFFRHGTPLEVALQGRNLNLVKFFLDEGARLDIRISSGRLPLNDLAFRGKVDYLRYIAAYHKNGGYPLLTLPFLAVIEGNLKALELLDCGVGTADEEGWGLLHYATHLGHVEIVRKLLEGGADVDAVTQDGLTPLYLAVGKGVSTHEAITGLLLKYKPQNTTGAFLFAAKNGLTSIINMLLEYGVDMNVVDESGRTGLVLALTNQRFNTADVLIKAGVSLNGVLVNSTIGHSSSTLRLLIDREVGLTPAAMKMALSLEDEKAVRILLEQGLDVPLDEVLRLTLAKKHSLLKLLSMSCGLKILSPIHLSVLCNDLPTLRTISGDVDITDEFGNSPLFYAVQLGYAEIIQHLLDRNAHVNITDKDGNTLLAVCIKNNSLKLFQIFLSPDNVDVVCNKDGDTPLLLAARTGASKIVSYLLDSADLSVVNYSDENSVTLSLRSGLTDICEELLERDVEIQTEAFFLAARKGFDPILEKAPIGLTDPDGKSLAMLSLENGHYKDLLAVSDLRGRDAMGRTLAHYMVSAKDKVGLTDLLERDASMIDVVEVASGNTCLIQACRMGEESIVDILISFDADLNLRNNAGESCLEVAMKDGCLDVARRLLREDIEVVDSSFLTAVRKGSLEFVKMILARLGTPSVAVLTEASGASVELGYVALFKYLISKFTVSLTDLLDIALTHNQPDIADMLIEKGATVSEEHLLISIRKGFLSTLSLILKGSFSFASDVLAVAIERRNRKAIRLLLDAGVKPNKSHLKDLDFPLLKLFSGDFKILTPVFLGVIKGRMLFHVPDVEAHVNDVDDFGRTPLYHAVLRRNVEMTRRLLGLHACPSQEVVSLSLELGAKEITSVLLEASAKD